MWRKTRSRNSGTMCVGTDPNRNWGYKWGGAGASTNPCSETYRGRTSFSEVETASIRDYLNKESSLKSFKLFLTYHSYGQYILYPWGYARVDHPNREQMHALGELAKEAKRAGGGNSYRVGSSAKLLYPAAGMQHLSNETLYDSFDSKGNTQTYYSESHSFFQVQAMTGQPAH